MNDMKKWEDEIIESIKRTELSFFCGAGISKNSGLPLADDLQTMILSKLISNQDDVNSLKGLPFEALMGAIPDNNTILNIFKQGKPNLNHILIAKIARKKYVKAIFTTNFDLLIEKAMENEGLKEDVHYVKSYNEDHFDSIDPRKSIYAEKVHLFKIHGSIDYPESIRSTIEAISSRTLSKKRAKIIEHLFSFGEHRRVLIMGYSCSDKFDIIPQIEQISNKSNKEIFFVEHIEKRDTEEIAHISSTVRNNPFKKFNGKWIKFNTDMLVKKISLLVQENNMQKFDSKFNTKIEWKKIVDEWSKGVKIDKGFSKYLSAALLFWDIENFIKAKEYLELAMRVAERLRYAQGISMTSLGLADIYCNLIPNDVGTKIQNLNDALVYYKKALKINENRVKDVAELSLCYHGMGRVYGDLESTFKDLSEKCFAKSRHIRGETKFLGFDGMGITYDIFENSKQTVKKYLVAMNKQLEEILPKNNQS